MKKQKYKKSGYSFDAKNEKRFNALTRRIEKALIDIEADLKSFSSKPTQLDLAKKSRCSVEILIKRSTKDAELNKLYELDKDGLPLKDESGKPIPAKLGWPLAELKRIQNIYWLMREKRKQGLRRSGTGLDNNDIQKPHNGYSEDKKAIQRQLSTLRGENAELKYEALNLLEKLVNKETSFENLEKRLSTLEIENLQLKEKCLKQKDEIRKLARKNLKVVE